MNTKPVRSVNMTVSTFKIPGRQGLQCDFKLVIRGASLDESRQIAAQAIGKARGASVQDSPEQPGAVEVFNLSANSIADNVLGNAALILAGLGESAPAQPAPAVQSDPL